MLVIRVLESLGLVSLIVALVLTVIGGVITKRTVVKISAALACFLSCRYFRIFRVQNLYTIFWHKFQFKFIVLDCKNDVNSRYLEVQGTF